MLHACRFNASWEQQNNVYSFSLADGSWILYPEIGSRPRLPVTHAEPFPATHLDKLFAHRSLLLGQSLIVVVYPRVWRWRLDTLAWEELTGRIGNAPSLVVDNLLTPVLCQLPPRQGQGQSPRFRVVLLKQLQTQLAETAIDLGPVELSAQCGPGAACRYRACAALRLGSRCVASLQHFIAPGECTLADALCCLLCCSWQRPLVPPTLPTALEASSVSLGRLMVSLTPSWRPREQLVVLDMHTLQSAVMVSCLSTSLARCRLVRLLRLRLLSWLECGRRLLASCHHWQHPAGVRSLNDLFAPCVPFRPRAARSRRTSATRCGRART